MISRAWVVAAVTVAGALALVWFAQPRVASVTPEAVVTALVSPAEQIAVETSTSRPVELAPARAPRAAASTASGAGAEPRAIPVPLPGDTAMPAHSDVPDPAARDRRFWAEPVDTEWAPGAEAELLRKLAEAPGLKVITMRVECRTTACRLEITLPPGPASEERGVPVDRTLSLRPTLVVASRDASGAPSTVMYFARPGHEPSFARPDTAAR